MAGTGKTGRRLVRTLRATGRHVRAASRSGEVRFDWSRPATWQPALAGASAVYLLAPEDPALAADFVTQAVDSGVGRFVALSGRGIDQIGDFSPGMVAAEEAVRKSGVQWTILRSNNFSQNFSEDMWRQPLLDGRLALPMGATPEPFVDAQDIADVAATLLTSPGHHEQVYDLSGPRALTFAAAVAMIAEATGRPIRYVQLTPEQYRAELLAEAFRRRWSRRWTSCSPGCAPVISPSRPTGCGGCSGVTRSTSTPTSPGRRQPARGHDCGRRWSELRAV